MLVAQRREPVGTPIWDLVPGLANPSVAGLLRSAMAGEGTARLELRAERLGRMVRDLGAGRSRTASPSWSRT